jgi:signal transduction histidine kinase
MNLFSKQSIKARIFTGFAIISSFILIQSYVSLKGNQTIEESFNRYAAISKSSHQILAIEKAVSDLQSSVQNFVYTGYTAVAQGIDTKIKNLELQLESKKQTLQGQVKAQEYATRMQGHLASYRKTFNFAVEEKSHRKKLISTLKDSLIRFKATTYETSSLKTALLDSEKNLYEYLQDPDILKINSSLKLLDREMPLIQNGQVSQQLLAYKANYIEIVQSTRGFLFLISVVMAAEAQEFAYVSTLLKNQILDQVEPLKNEVSENRKITKNTILIASAILLILAIMLSLSISKSINSPISELTQTFTLLAKGQNIDSIPNLELKDEIGDMAKAAEVFRQKNKETVQLVTELDEKKEALERSVNELDQFVYTVSHDLKSPIVTSMGFLGIMKDLAQQGLYEEVLTKIPTLEKANRRMNQLIDDLLELSRVDKIDTQEAEVDMNQLLNEILAQHQRDFTKFGISVAIDNELPNLEISESRALQLFDNLVTNAIKYCVNDQGPKVTIGCHKRDNTYAFFVKDNGPGIAKDYHSKVFTLFQRLQKDDRGTGIGLSIVQKIMKSQGGNVWIESGEGIEGCTFWLEFPKIKKVA